jgi:disease resistance protein RPM1
MADLVMGAMGSIIPKLGELLKEEYSLQTGVKDRIRSLTRELELAQAALGKVAEVPWDQLDKQVQIWARNVREASYDMEDVLDTFLVRVKGPESAEEKQSLRKYLKKMTNLFKKSKNRRKISGDVKDIMTHLQEVTEQCRRYKVGDISVAMPDTASVVDPRLHAMYNKVEDLVGIHKSSGELISILRSPQREVASNQKMKIVSIVGVGGLGKTTLAKTVYDKLKGDFIYGAFVPVGRNPDLKKLLKDILMDLDKQRRLQLSGAVLDERQLIDELRPFLENKRYPSTTQFRGFMLAIYMLQPTILTPDKEIIYFCLSQSFKYF